MLEPGLLYFAYGCNMDSDFLSRLLDRRVGRSHAARADGFRLKFNKGGEGEKGDSVTANLVEDAEHCVYGVVHSIPKTAVEALDRFEGVPEHYRRATLWVRPLRRHARQAALAYLAQPAWTVPDGRPEPDYLELLLRGAAAHDLPHDYIEWLTELARGSDSGGYPIP